MSLSPDTFFPEKSFHMRKKSIWTFIKYYCFVWCSTKKRFSCEKVSNNEYLLKNTFAGHESISLILLGIFMGVFSYFYNERYMFSFLMAMLVVFLYTLFVVINIWFSKLDDIFDN